MADPNDPSVPETPEPEEGWAEAVLPPPATTSSKALPRAVLWPG